MTLGRWLEQATAGLPPEVAQRVRAEYTAHVSESGLPEAQAVAMLGQPEAVQRALRRTYLDGEQLERLRERRMSEKFLLLLPLGFSVLLVGFGASDAMADGIPLPWRDWWPSALTWTLVGLAWWLTRSMHPERRRHWRIHTALWSLQVLFWSPKAFALWRGEDVSLPWFIPLWGLALVGWLGHTVLEERRLRRTLALKESRL